MHHMYPTHTCTTLTHVPHTHAHITHMHTLFMHTTLTHAHTHHTHDRLAPVTRPSTRCARKKQRGNTCLRRRGLRERIDEPGATSGCRQQPVSKAPDRAMRCLPQGRTNLVQPLPPLHLSSTLHQTRSETTARLLQPFSRGSLGARSLATPNPSP